MYATRTMAVWALGYWASVWAMLWTLGLSRPTESHMKQVKEMFGLRIRPIRGIGKLT